MKAIVIGGSFTGCMVAQTLSEHFDSITIVEKGDFSDTTDYRQYVPQERHAHLVLQKGIEIIERTFGGITDELIEEGSIKVNLGNDTDWFQHGHWKKNYSSQMELPFFSRNLLDCLIRRRILNNNKVDVQSNTKVIDIAYDKSNNTVSGVYTKKGEVRTLLEGDFVVDSSGFGSKMYSWLQKKGYERVAKQQIKKNLGYVSRIYELDPEYDKKAIAIWSSDDATHDISVVLPMEGNRWMVSVGGCFDRQPNSDEYSYLNFMKELPGNKLYPLIQKSEPISETHSFKFLGSTWYRYDKLTNYPDNLIIIGAALCAINPFYGQGITICAQQVEILEKRIIKWKEKRMTAGEIQKSFNACLIVPWKMAEVEDLRHNGVVGKRGVNTKLLQWYSKKFEKLSNTDIQAREVQFNLINLKKSPISIFRPDIFIKVITSVGMKL